MTGLFRACFADLDDPPTLDIPKAPADGSASAFILKYDPVALS